MKRSFMGAGLGAAIALTISDPYIEPPIAISDQAQPDRKNRVSQKKRRQRNRWKR
ncbi:hypothetical protein [Maricurvus nonylphenolicus]|uniref:hypothetical protein n=1 Tax=Maricurvus nonylphenolicus TaxID=1008307 RepID=UPI0036F33FA1